MTWWNLSSPFWDYDAIICDGAVRSGKTFSMGLSFILWAMSRFEGRQFGLCGKTIDSLKRNVLSDVLPALSSLGVQFKEKRNLITVRLNGRENRFYIFGGKDESSSALIQGITFAGVLLDEVALMPRSFVEQACARCSVTGSKLWFNCNPEGPYHWFYLEWIKKAEDRNALYLHFTMEDNPSLSRRIISRYETMYTGVFYQRFILGQWVTAKGLVYDFFKSEQCPAAPQDGFDLWHISCDYGTANPASFGLWGRKDGVWYRVEEYYYDSRREGVQKTDAEYARQVRLLAAGREIASVIVDPSAASFIEALRRDGWRVVKAVNDVLSGIRLTADLLKSGGIVICKPCFDTIREFGMYCWDDNLTGRDVVKKENDHAMDDIRYFAATVLGNSNDGFAVTYAER